MAIELPNDTITTIFNYQGKNNIYCSVDIEKKQLQFNDADTPLLSVDFSIDSFYEELIKAGGWVEYADKKY
jgi:3-isopropylmalate/(R)-2-methylmalate dehydratase small subunit